MCKLKVQNVKYVKSRGKPVELYLYFLFNGALYLTIEDTELSVG